MAKPEFLGLTTDTWQAIGSTATAGAFLVAAGAVVVAFFQLRQARDAATKQLNFDRETAAAQLEASRKAAAEQLEQARQAVAEQLAHDRKIAQDSREQTRLIQLEQSRPYVLMSVEKSPLTMSLFDLVVENVGAGPALDVIIKVDPPFRRVNEAPGQELAGARIFREAIPMLPPSYRMATFFDSAIDRHEAPDGTLPDTHEVTITYNDSRGNSWLDRTTLDMTILDGLLFGEEYGIHHVAKSLKEIEKFFKKSKPLTAPLHVISEDRDAYADRQRRTREQSEARHAEMVARLEAQQRGAESDTSADQPLSDAADED